MKIMKGDLDIQDTWDRLRDTLNDKLYFVKMGEHPIMVKRRLLTDEEVEDPSNRGAKGVKTFYFYFTHIKGNSKMNENKLYKDWNWITRDETN